jgi:hypothetical protein
MIGCVSGLSLRASYYPDEIYRRITAVGGGGQSALRRDKLNIRS